MRAYDLVVYLVLFSAVMGLLDYSEEYEGAELDMGNAEFNHSAYEAFPAVGDSGATELGWGDSLYQSTFGQLGMLGSVIGRVVYIKDIIANAFGGSEEALNVAWMIQAGVWLTYTIGIIQAVTGRSAKSME